MSALLEKLCLNGTKATRKQNREIDFSLMHPLRLIRNNEMLPINVMFNSKSESFSKISQRALCENTNPYEAIEKLSKRSPLFLQEILTGDSSTFTKQINTSFFRLYMHSFFVQGGLIAKTTSSKKTTKRDLDPVKCAFIPINYEMYCDFDEKIRLVEGYYIFIGESLSSIVIQGKPLNTVAGPRLIIHEFEFTSDLMPKEYDFIRKCFDDLTIEGKFISVCDVYKNNKSISKTISKTLKSLNN